MNDLIESEDCDPAPLLNEGSLGWTELKDGRTKHPTLLVIFQTIE